MFISRKLAMGKGGSGRRGPPGHPPPLAGVTQRSPFFCCHQSARPEKKDLFPLREVARIGNTETRASQISVDKGTEPSFLQTHHCWSGGGVPSWGLWVQHGWSGPGGGWAAPSRSELLRAALHAWLVQRGTDTAPSTFSL